MQRRVGVGHSADATGPILGVVTVERWVPRQVRIAGALVAVQALVALGFAIVIGVQAAELALPASAVLGETAAFVVIGLALLGVGVGLATGRRGARTPAIVTQLLLLPVVYSLIGPSQQLVLGIATGVYVVATFLLLISEPSKLWSMGLEDQAHRPGSAGPTGAG